MNIIKYSWSSISFLAITFRLIEQIICYLSSLSHAGFQYGGTHIVDQILGWFEILQVTTEKLISHNKSVQFDKPARIRT